MSDNPRWARTLGKPQPLFLLFLLAVAIAYTVLGSRLLRRTAAGAMGPGFLPVWLGLAAIGGLLVGLVITVVRRRAPSPEAESAGSSAEAEAGPTEPADRSVATLGVVVAGFTGLVLGFPILGALVSVALFVVAMLWYLNRHLAWWIWGVSVALSVSFWFLFEALGVYLPHGFLL